LTLAAAGGLRPTVGGGIVERWFGSLKARMALVLGLVLLLPAAYAVFQAITVYANQAERQVIALRRTASNISAYQTDLLSQARVALDGIATRPELQREPGACSTFLNAEVSKAERFANFAVTDEAGRVTCASASLLLGRDVSGMPWFQEVKGRGGAVLSEVVPEQQPGEGRRVVLAMPLLRDGQFIGTLSGGLAVPRFAVLPSGLELPDGAVAYLVDRTGRLVSDADPSSLTLPGWTDIVSLIAEAESIIVADGPSGRMQFVAVPVQSERVYALVGLPAPLWSWLERDLVLGLIVPVLMLALAVIGIWIATDYLVNRHIHTLARAARDYATGRHAAWPGLRGAPTELRQLTQVLAQTTEELSARESELKASLAQKEVLLREIHHRVKNNLQVVTSLLNLRAQAATSPAARLAMIEAQSRIKAMALVHRDLYEGEEVGAVELQTLLGELCHLLEDTVPSRAGEIDLKLALEPTRLSVDRAVPVALFVTEAVSNAFKHAFPEGRRGTVTVRLGRTPTSASLEISDDGVGIENAQGAPGLGLTLMRMLAGQTGGRLAIDNSQGTAVRLEFPLQSRKAQAASAATVGA
jgi:two-component sensor histidine kinase